MTQDLIDGVQSFQKYNYDPETGRMPALATGQDPKYFIISCIDSRCNPGTIFRAPPGIFLSHKAMGAIIRPYQKGTALSAALQFALSYNQIETIIVLGHTQCGAIKALAEDIDDPEISSFVNVAQNALTKAQSCCDGHDNTVARTEEEVILESMENLKNYPSVAKALAENQVNLKAWQFDVRSGDLREYQESTKSFITLNSESTLSESRKAL